MGRHRERYCRHGHDTARCGRRRNGNCIACDNARNATTAFSRRRAVAYEPPPFPANMPTINFGPLCARMLAEGIRPSDIASGDSLRRYERWGIPVFTGDNWCVTHLRCHPVDVWGAAWFEDEETA